MLDLRVMDLRDLGGREPLLARGEAGSLSEALKGIDQSTWRVRWIRGNTTDKEIAAANVDPVLRKWFD